MKNVVFTGAIKRLILMSVLATLPHVSFAASLEKAAVYMEKGDVRAAQKQYAAVIRKGSARERETAYLELARSYFNEKDFRGAIRSLEAVQDRVPENKTGAWMHLILYRSARAIRDFGMAARHHQALLRLQPDFSWREISEYLNTLRTIELLQPGRQSLDTATESAAQPRQDGFFIAESLMAIDITGGAKRMWMALLSGRLDDIGRTSLFRLAQALDIEGNWVEAAGYLKLYVMLFAEDIRSADALYRLGKWSLLLETDQSDIPLELVAEYYPSTLYGARARIDLAWAAPSRKLVRAAIQAVRESPGLPDAVLERGLALAFEYTDWIEDGPTRSWIARRYLAAFPAGRYVETARSFKEP